jgi:Hemerythrin HHE cation binding domain
MWDSWPGIGAVILVGVTTQDREAPADTRDMYMVHTMFRREFAALPTLVRGVAAADAEPVDLIAEHTGLLTAVLEAHHRAVDAHLSPRLLDRAEEDLGPVVHVMEEQHERIEQLTAQAVVVLGEWREDPAAERRIRLADALDRSHAALYTHMGMEEERSLEVRTLLAQQGPQECAAHSVRVHGTPTARAAVSRSGAPRDDHSSHIKFRSIRRRNSNDS